MNTTLSQFDVEIPLGTDQATLDEIEREITALTGVGHSGQGGSRSLDAQSITFWVTLASTVVTTAGAAIPIVKEVMAIFRKKGIKGVKLVLANGSTLEADEMSVEDFAKLNGTA